MTFWPNSRKTQNLVKTSRGVFLNKGTVYIIFFSVTAEGLVATQDLIF